MVRGKSRVLFQEGTLRDEIDVVDQFPEEEIKPSQFFTDNPSVASHELDDSIKDRPAFR